jgi:hypothetical protein
MKPRCWLLLASTLGAIACGSDLGDRNPVAAKQLVYGRGGLVATKGQALMHDSCGNAAFCHSSSANGADRQGAPGELDFDMLPAPVGWPTAIEHRDEIWEVVLAGEMPPKGSAKSKLGDGDWMFDPARRDGGEHLPALASEEGKAALRNWLASDAPVVTATTVPVWAQPPALLGDGGAAGADWAAIYQQVIEPSCAIAGCHNAQSASGGLDLQGACDAYDQLLAQGACKQPRVIPGDGDSFLLDKLEAEKPACGGRMPPTAPLGADAIASVRTWIEAGAPAEQCR